MSTKLQMSTKVRLLKCYVWSTLLYGCESWDCLVKEWNRSWKLQKCVFTAYYVLYGLIKCQMKKYFKEQIHQEISCRLLLTDKSDLWDTSWERVSWKRLRWPGWLKAKELEVDKGKRLWTGYHWLVGNNDRSTIYWKSAKNGMCIIIRIANVRVWHSTYIWLDWYFTDWLL